MIKLGDKVKDKITGFAGISAAQVGKTEAMYNCLGFAIDRHPGPAMVIMPDQEMTKRISKDRIKQMIENYKILDEVDKYPEFPRRNPIKNNLS